MNSLFDVPFILDGAMGTELKRAGLPIGECTERWVLENPEAVIKLQRAYAAAGADAVCAPTFGANRALLKAHGVPGGCVSQMNRQLVAISFDGVGDRALIAGDMSPTGLAMPPFGTASFEELISIFEEQAAALHEAGVHYFAIETQMLLGEARAAVKAVQRVSDRPILCSFTCGSSGCTAMGSSLISGLAVMQDMGVSAYGVNCCGSFELINSLLRDMQPIAAIPLSVQPNAGQPVVRDGEVLYTMTPDDFASAIPELASAGAGIFGGCCGTTPEHISALKQVLGQVDFQADTAEAIDSARICASETQVLVYDASCRVSDLAIDDDIIEAARELTAKGAQLLRIAPRDLQDVEILLENQYGIRTPLMLDCGDAKLCAKAQHGYHGKLLRL